MNRADEIQWFPMRVTYNREMKMRMYLDEIGIENFVPMRYCYAGTGWNRRKTLVPAVHNIIFVKSSRRIITERKMYDKNFAPMRYMMRHGENGGADVIMTVCERQMLNFMRVAECLDCGMTYLQMNEYVSSVGRRVRICEGPFSGVEGVIKRIHGNKHVVVQLEDIAAVAIDFVPKDFLMEII